MNNYEGTSRSRKNPVSQRTHPSRFSHLTARSALTSLLAVLNLAWSLQTSQAGTASDCKTGDYNLLVYHSVQWTNVFMCGFPGFAPSAGENKRYLQMLVTEDKDHYLTISGEVGGGGLDAWYIFTFGDTFEVSSSSTMEMLVACSDPPQVASWSGSRWLIGQLDGTYTCYGDTNYAWWPCGPYTDPYGCGAIRSESDPGVWTGDDGVTPLPPELDCGQAGGSGPPAGVSPVITPTTYTLEFSTNESRLYSQAFGAGMNYHTINTDYSYSLHKELINEFTREMLGLSATYGALGAPPKGPTAKGGRAFRKFFGANDATGAVNEGCTGQAWTYTIVFRGEQDQEYTISWNQITNVAGSIVGVDSKKETFRATGQAQSFTYSVRPPGFALDLDAEVTMSEPEVKAHGCRGGRCDRPEGTAAYELQSAFVDLSMGFRRIGPDAGKGVGSLQLHEFNASPLLYSPQVLKVFDPFQELDIVSAAGNVVRQARSDACLADVQTISPSAFRVDFYRASQTGTLTNGLYAFTGEPFVTFTFHDPGPGEGGMPRLRITETRGGHSTDTDFIFHGYNFQTGGKWELHERNGMRKIIKTIDGCIGTSHAVTFDHYDPASGALRHRNRREYEDLSPGISMADFPAGEDPENLPLMLGEGVRLIREILGDGADDWSMVRKFDAHGLHEATLQSDGPWETYQRDQIGRLITRYASLGNQGPTNVMSQAQATVFSYNPIAPGDSGADMLAARVVTRWNSGVGTSSQLLSLQPFSEEVRRFGTANEGWSIPGARTNLANFYDTGPEQGKPRAFLGPDGVMSLTSYLFDQDTNVIGTVTSRGKPSADGTAVVSGTRTIRAQTPAGKVQSVIVKDIATDTVLSSETYTDLDPEGQSQLVTYHDGTTRTVTRSCCGVESEVDRDGTQTTYIYDDLGRQVGVVRNGITTLNVLDPMDRVVRTVRIGRDGSEVFLAGYAYDLLGRVTHQTNAALQVTTHVYYLTNGFERVTVTTHPDQSTRVETLYRDGRVKSVTGTAVHPVRYEYGVSNREWTREILLQEDGSDSGEWVETTYDGFGNVIKVAYPDGAWSASAYTIAGQLDRQHDADGIHTFHRYNDLAELEYTAQDANGNGLLDFAGSDRITRTVTDHATGSAVTGGVPVRRTRTYVWNTNGVDSPTLLSTAETTLDGLRSWHTVAGQTSSTQTEYFTNGVRLVTQIAPDGSSTISVFQAGLLQSATRFDINGVQLGQAAYGYDAHDRPVTVTDARNGTTTYTYDAADRVVATTSPPPAPGEAALTTQTHYDVMGRLARITHPDGSETFYEYHPTGQLKLTHGSRAYPVGYTYDYAGRVKTMTTWRHPGDTNTAAVTTWNYHSQRGWLVSKQYPHAVTGAPGGPGPSYNYTAAGRLRSRSWARTLNGQSLTNSYAYNLAGDLAAIDYSDPDTPDVAYTYDRRGRATRIQTGTFPQAAVDDITLAYDELGLPLSETHTAGLLAGLRVTNSYDPLLRRSGLSAFHDSTRLTQLTYAHDPASRLASVSDGTNSSTYGYLANSPLVQNIGHRQNGLTVMTTVKQHDFLNRLTSISSSSSSSFSSSAAYQYNQASQRTRATRADDSYWVYDYDDLGQVTSGRKYFADATPVPGWQFDYAFDAIGNRTATGAGGDALGEDLAVSSYTANALNQYTSRTVPGRLPVTGTAHTNAAVAVNGTPAWRQGAFFWDELSVTNDTLPVWLAVTVEAEREGETTTRTGRRYVPWMTEGFGHDADGNLTSDGRWALAWDGENRLREVLTHELALTAGAPDLRLKFDYDGQGRRIRKRVSAWAAAIQAWVNTDERYVYDGWNLLGILTPDSRLLYSFTWGTDLSGTMQGAGHRHAGVGAGGVGGLLAMTVHEGALAGTYFYCYDGNGNVAALVSAATGQVVAEYEYGPFGEVVRMTGPLAAVNPFRFSTKFQDDETGWLYYGYRYYDPTVGRWASRDPIGERGGLNLSCFLDNQPASRVDPLGQNPYDSFWSSSDVRKNRFFTNFRIALSDDVKAVARKHCVPELLLAGIIANELIEDTSLYGVLVERTGEYWFGVGDSVRPAQIHVDTAIRYNLTDVQVDDFKDDLPTTFDGYSNVRTKQEKYRQAVRAWLLTPRNNIEAAGKLLKKNLEETCGRALLGTMGKSFSREIAPGCLPDEFCCRWSECSKVVAFDPPQCLFMAHAAIWNNGLRIIDLPDIPRRAPNAYGHASSALLLHAHRRELLE